MAGSCAAPWEWRHLETKVDPRGRGGAYRLSNIFCSAAVARNAPARGQGKKGAAAVAAAGGGIKICRIERPGDAEADSAGKGG